MIKRFLVYIFIYFLITVLPHTNSNIWISQPFILKACAQEVLKINSINFDNSDSIIFLGTSGGSEDIESFNITKKILTVKNCSKHYKSRCCKNSNPKFKKL